MPTLTELSKFRGAQLNSATLSEDRLAREAGYNVATITDIDLTSVATTTLYTVPSDKTLMLLGVILQVTAETTATVPPDASVGINPSTDNVFAAETLVGLNAVGKTYYFWSNLTTSTIAGPGDVIDLRVSVGATAGALDATARVVGILV
jgi:hypothetical protein